MFRLHNDINQKKVAMDSLEFDDYVNLGGSNFNKPMKKDTNHLLQHGMK
jgi:hypothetical protein